jgi:hypothetical protein
MPLLAITGLISSKAIIVTVQTIAGKCNTVLFNTRFKFKVSPHILIYFMSLQHKNITKCVKR